MTRFREEQTFIVPSEVRNIILAIMDGANTGNHGTAALGVLTAAHGIFAAQARLDRAMHRARHVGIVKSDRE